MYTNQIILSASDSCNNAGILGLSVALYTHLYDFGYSFLEMLNVLRERLGYVWCGLVEF